VTIFLVVIHHALRYNLCRPVSVELPYIEFLVKVRSRCEYVKLWYFEKWNQFVNMLRPSTSCDRKQIVTYTVLTLCLLACRADKVAAQKSGAYEREVWGQLHNSYSQRGTTDAVISRIE
jgi:hypothetical protein